ncbi:MAG TPA: SRPBCC family protein [Solirubrobacterales bacterium]
MEPVTVTVEVAKPRQEVFDFLDLLANHESFMDHLFTDWEFSGPRRGVGAKARVRQNAPGSQDHTEFEVVEVAPDRIVEEGVGAKGRRRTRGTYRLEELPGGGTRISFELAWIEAPRGDRMIPFMTRAFVRRANGRGMRRLAKQLDG